MNCARTTISESGPASKSRMPEAGCVLASVRRETRAPIRLLHVEAATAVADRAGDAPQRVLGDLVETAGDDVRVAGGVDPDVEAGGLDLRLPELIVEARHDRRRAQLRVVEMGPQLAVLVDEEVAPIAVVRREHVVVAVALDVGDAHVVELLRVERQIARGELRLLRVVARRGLAGSEGHESTRARASTPPVRAGVRRRSLFVLALAIGLLSGVDTRAGPRSRSDAAGTPVPAPVTLPASG